MENENKVCKCNMKNKSRKHIESVVEKWRDIWERGRMLHDSQSGENLWRLRKIHMTAQIIMKAAATANRKLVDELVRARGVVEAEKRKNLGFLTVIALTTA